LIAVIKETYHFSSYLKILPIILLSNLTKHAEGVIGDHRYIFRSNNLSTDNILSIGQIVKIKWEHIELVYQNFIGLNIAYDSVMKYILYNTLIQLVITMNVVSLTNMCPNETYSKE
jgi:hypothetical protein